MSKELDRFPGVEDPVEILRLLHASAPRLKWSVRYEREVVAALDELEGRRAIDLALQLLDDGNESAMELAGMLALAGNFDLGALQEGWLDRGRCWPPHLFRAALPSVRDKLLSLLESPETNDHFERQAQIHRLIALTWIGDEAVVNLFAAWQAKPPDWAEEVLGSIAEIPHDAGWEVDGEGSRRELTLSSCWPLVAGTAEPGAPIRALIPGEEPCGGCGRPAVALLEVDGRSPALAGLSLPALPLAVGTCLTCGGYGTITCGFDSGGRFHGVTRSTEPFSNDPWEVPSNLLVLGAARRAPWALVDQRDGVSISQLGGLPSWEQDPDYPQCPGCQHTMLFIGQVSIADLEEYGEGIYYAFLCAPCHRTATVYQQT